ncbi:hypothetical protein P8452_51083 [Trifolium repens]|nr:hypothetical protein P8452_51083 [Trifolium repens]
MNQNLSIVRLRHVPEALSGGDQEKHVSCTLTSNNTLAELSIVACFFVMSWLLLLCWWVVAAAVFSCYRNPFYVKQL